MVAFFYTIIMGFVGMVIDANLKLDGSFSTVLAIATMGSFILSRMGRDDPDEPEQDESDNDTDQI